MRATAERKAAKYVAASMKNAMRSACSRRQQFLPGASSRAPFMLSKMARPSRMACTIVAKLSSGGIMRAASFVTSVPAMPMAMPMSADFRASASFRHGLRGLLGRLVDDADGAREDEVPFELRGV